MKRSSKKLLLALTGLLFLSPLTTNALDQLPLQSIAPSKDYVDGEIIVKYKNYKKNLLDVSKSQDISVQTPTSKNSEIKAIKSTKKSTQELLKEFENNPNIEYAEPNYRRNIFWSPNDSFFAGNQWSHYNINDHDIDSTDAWDIENPLAQETIVAVIDSGLNYTHEDLDQNLWDGGPTYPNHGWDFVDDDNNPDDTAHSEDGFQGHGTHVSSIFSSTTDNSLGKAGISRYNNIKVMALRFDLDSISTVAAINFAKDNGVKVINASYGGTGYSQYEKDAIAAFPGILVAAAGNDGRSNDDYAMYPCNYNLDNVICVGATNDDDNLSSFSNYSNTQVDIAAPGESVVIANDATLGCYSNYCSSSGTSYATPFVAGTVALMYAHNPTASISTIKNTLLYSSDHLTSLNDKISCSRRLNLNNALQNIINSTIPTEYCDSPIYRFWSKKNKSHFYTASETEKNLVIANYDDYTWKYEGVAYSAPDENESHTTPVYRFWSKKHKGHFYTASEAEKNLVIANYDDYVWKYEGVAYYAFISPQSETKPVYRFWSSKNKHHFYTASEAEKDLVISEYDDYVWKYEGIAWHVPN